MAIVNDTSSGTNNNTLLYVSVIGFAIISYVLYKFVLSTQPANTQRQQRTTAASTSRTIRPSTSTTSSTASSTTTTTKNNTENDDYKFGQSRHPSHLLPPSNWSDKSNKNREDLSGYLLKGIIPFRSTYANGYETRLQQQKEMKNSDSSKDEEVKDLVVINRKERARIFARMFSTTSTSAAAKSTSSPSKPPNRGSNIVITIHHTDVITTTASNNCVDSKLHKILYLLGTYYNVFVLVDASDVQPKITKDEEVKEYIDKIRTQLYTNNNSSSNNNINEYQLNEQIIPNHRIIVTTTTSGRVAFVRQLADTQLVIDYDVEGVVKELERFGFRTLCYPRVEGMGEGGGESSLGKFLIP